MQFKRKALKDDFSKHPLTAIIDSARFLRKDATITLIDPTGKLVVSILSECFEGHARGFCKGAVLVLKDVLAVMYPQRKARGYFVDIDECFHLAIKKVSIVQLFAANHEVDLQLVHLPQSCSYNVLLPL